MVAGYVISRALGIYAVHALPSPPDEPRALGEHIGAEFAALAVLRDHCGRGVSLPLARRFARDFLGDLTARRSGAVSVRRERIEAWLASGEVAA